MRKMMAFMVFVAVGWGPGLVPGTAVAMAGETPTPATIIAETSVACGTKQQSKKQSTSLVCQQYTVRTSTTEYQVRQEKPSDKDILAPNTPIEFTLSKDKMKFKVNGKKYEFLVVGTSGMGAQTR
jgi:hypothetical protein